MMLVGAYALQAQNTAEKDIKKLAREYAKSSSPATLKIDAPQLVTIKESNSGYDIGIEGTENGESYKISLTHCIITPAERCTIKTDGRWNDTEESATFNDADRITLKREPGKQSIIVEKEGDEGYKFIIHQEGESSDSRTIYKETNTNWDFNIPFMEKSNRRLVRNRQAYFSFDILSDLEFGMGLVSAHSQAPGMDIGFDNAGWEFLLNNIFKWEYRPLKSTRFTLGFGVDWRNYRMRGENRFLKEENKLTVAPYPEGADIDFSRVKVFAMTLELMIRQNLGKNISIQAGPVINFSTHASIKTRYSLGSGKEKESFKETSNNIKQKPVTVDLKAQMNFRRIGIYFKYSPENILDTNYAPEFKSMSAGISIEIF